MKTLANAFFVEFFLFFSLLIPASVFGQAGCLTEEEAKRVINLLDAPGKAAENKALRRELLSMQESYQKLEQKIAENWEENQHLAPSLNEMGEKHLRRLCEIVKQKGWLKRDLVSGDGAAAAALSIIRANRAFDLQREIFPVAAAAAQKGYVGKHEVAWLIDSIRVSARRRQIFGTQTVVRDEIFYLYPLQNEARVDQLREMYNLLPLADYIKYLQARYHVVVLKSPRPPANLQQKEKRPEPAAANTADQLLNLEKDDVVRIESKLVNLHVRVSASDSASTNFNLQKSDFVVFENDQQQEIEFFSAAETPFDLILLLDVSVLPKRR